MSSLVEAAERNGANDGRYVVQRVADLRARGFSGRTLLVDGTQYSPSWRALEGGSNVWSLGDDVSPESAADLQEVYSETLDRYTDEAGAYWDEGCLWWASDDFDHEADEAPSQEAPTSPSGGYFEERAATRLERAQLDEAPVQEAPRACVGCPCPHSCQYGRACQGNGLRARVARAECEAAGLDWDDQERLRRALALRLAPSPWTALADRLGEVPLRCPECGRGASHTVGVTRPVSTCYNGHRFEVTS